MIKISKLELKRIIVEEFERYQNEIHLIQLQDSKKTQRKKKKKKESDRERKERLFAGWDDFMKLSNGIAQEAHCSGRNRDEDGYFSDETTDGSYASDDTCPDEPTRKASRTGTSKSTPKTLPCGCEINDTDGCLQRHPHRCSDGKKYSQITEGDERQLAAYIAAVVADELKKMFKQLQQQQQTSSKGGCDLEDVDRVVRSSKGSLHKKPTK